MLTGRSVSADEARDLGLVRKVVTHERLISEAMAYAEQIAAQPPIAVQFAKRALVRSLDSALLAQLELEWSYQVAAFDTADAHEGITAFREHRPPRFSGS
jgi:enoyl-CoA hydratase/carnithine racemase